MRTLNIAVRAAVIACIVIYPTISLAGMNSMTDAKLYLLELQLEPATPIVGNNAAILTVSDARSNRKIDDAVIEIVPWMTMHSHGSTKKPIIKKVGAGQYHVENLYYTMEGDWDLLVTIQNGGSHDTATFSISNVKKK
jgi:hypothetical protein